jgi:hypothetical protein
MSNALLVQVLEMTTDEEPLTDGAVLDLVYEWVALHKDNIVVKELNDVLAACAAQYDAK